ncbi:uncharacterized protein LOC122647821 [Telopea speciosissima]|uniref:uncharacterized protein LOC122647821 n=1 Tax=Telopea speciosissima TaxID=54955 RepID=UPI001CC6F13B|nr:uncharacterized protein LOC122647821 [Telopea speciosissima]
MVGFIRFRIIFSAIVPVSSPIHIPVIASTRFSHCGTTLGFWYPACAYSSSSLVPRRAGNNVAIFWDLDNKLPNSLPPYDAAVKLKTAASAFGVVRSMVAYANHHAFRYVPPVVRERRKERKALDQLEKRGLVKPAEPYICRVCGRKFYTNDKLVNHFKQIHEREQVKRLNRLESARGKRRVQLVAKFSMKMEKYKNSARDVLTPKVGYGLADELKRAGFWVQTVSNKPQAADNALRNHMVDMMDRKLFECLVLVSDDSDFVDVLREAKLRCLKTVVVGDNDDGALKRCADSGFSWKEVILGKAKKEAVSVVGRWKDREVLKRLEWTYRPELEKKEVNLDDSEVESEGVNNEDIFSDKNDNSELKEKSEPWWKLDSSDDDSASNSF